MTNEELQALGMDIEHCLVFCDGLPIGRKLRVKRAHDNLSLVKCGEILKIPKTTLSEIETGARKVPRKHEKAIHDYLYHMYFDDGQFVEWWGDNND